MELSITLYTVSSIELLLGCSWIIIYIKKCLFEKNKERIIFHSLISRVTGGALFLQSAHCECQVEGWGHERRITVFRFAALFCGSAQPPIHSTNLGFHVFRWFDSVSLSGTSRSSLFDVANFLSLGAPSSFF